MASQFEGLYQAKKYPNEHYLDIVRIWAKQFQLMDITLKPRNDFRHANTITYLATALEDDVPKQILVDNQGELCIKLNKADLKETFM